MENQKISKFCKFLDGSDILLEIKGKLEKKVAIGWDLHSIRLQCTKLFYSRQDSSREERHIELPNCEIRIDQIDNRDVIVISDPFNSKIHRFRVETVIEKRRDNTKKELNSNNTGSFAQWSALINGFYTTPDTESNDVQALVLSMNRELMNLEREFRNASKFKRLEELIGKLSSIRNISLEQSREESSPVDTMNKRKKSRTIEPVAEPKGEIETSEISCQTCKIDDDETESQSSQPKTAKSTSNQNEDHKSTNAPVCEFSTPLIKKQSSSTSTPTDSMEGADDTMGSINSHDISAEMPEIEAEKVKSADGSKDTEDKAYNDQR